MLPAGNPGPPFGTDSGKVEIENFTLDEPLPRYLPPSKSKYPLRLMTAPALHILNSSFCERDDIRETEGGMQLQLNTADAAERKLASGDRVVARNDLGEVEFLLTINDGVPKGIAVAEGVWWNSAAPGDRTVNALTSQVMSDMGRGSTFYDNFIEVKKK